MKPLTMIDKFFNWLFSFNFWCKLGCHRWTWTIGGIGVGYYIPPHAKCERCNTTYEKEELNNDN